MKLSRYSKAIASAIGTAIATGIIVYTQDDPGNIGAVSASLTGALNTLFVIFSPKNAD